MAKKRNDEPGIGHNSDGETNVAAEELLAFIERVERLEEEKKTISEDIKDVYGEAKGRGYDTKILRKVISIRKQDKNERAEQEAILDLYLTAIGMKAGTRDGDLV